MVFAGAAELMADCPCLLDGRSFEMVGSVMIVQQAAIILSLPVPPLLMTGRAGILEFPTDGLIGKYLELGAETSKMH
jgi:hypothetical protein